MPKAAPKLVPDRSVQSKLMMASQVSRVFMKPIARKLSRIRKTKALSKSPDIELYQLMFWIWSVSIKSIRELSLVRTRQQDLKKHYFKLKLALAKILTKVWQHQSYIAQIALVYRFIRKQFQRARMHRLTKTVHVDRRGVVNLGNTCFMNSALQCLFRTEQIESRCREYAKHGSTPLISTYLRLCEQMRKSGQPYRPVKIKQIVGAQNQVFKDYRQADSSEWISTFLTKLVLQTNQVRTVQSYEIDDSLRKTYDRQYVQMLWAKSRRRDQLSEKSIVDDIIYGRHKVTYQCLTCRKYTQQTQTQDGAKTDIQIQCRGLYTLFERFQYVYLPLPLSKGRNEYSLTDCFDKLCAPQRLTGASKIQCDDCQSQQDTQKQTTIYETNQILILCMSRLNHNGKKDRQQIVVPICLDGSFMAKYGNRQSSSYRLYAMLNHIGKVQSGHYTATCFDSDNQWVHYDDQFCQPITQDRALRTARSAYALFYRRNY